MKRSYLCSFLMFHVLIFYCLGAFAWNHSIEIGYGYCQDPNHPRYHNSGGLLSGDIIPLPWWHTPWTFLTITGSLGQWHTNSPRNKNLTTVAVSAALRYHLFRIDTYDYPPYLFASFGPAYLSSRHFNKNTQAKNVAIQSNLGFGIELNYIDVNLRLVHFSNAYLASPNDGFNILYLLSIGYLFS